MTSRSESRRRDDEGIDLMSGDDNKIPFEFQCKTVCKGVNYHKLLSGMPNRSTPVVLHQYTEKRGDRFYEVGTYAILPLKDFIEILDDLKSEGVIF